jgi:nucleotide-binding universal stress UspA family protein
MSKWVRRSRAGERATPAHIVIGVDLRSTSRAAVLWGTVLAKCIDAEITVVHALGQGEAIAPEVLPVHSVAAQVTATLERDWNAPLRLAGIPYQVRVRVGSPIDVLRRVVDAEEPDMLVVGRRATGGTAALAPGSTSLGMLVEPQVPTLVVPETGPPGRGRPTERPAMRSVLVGIDGSQPSLRALDLASDLAELSAGELVAVAAVEETPVFPLGPATTLTSEGERDAPGRAAAMLTAACEPARRRGVRVETVCRRGIAAQVLLRSASALDVDLVVVGTRGVGAPDSPLLGSVSRRIVCEADTPVLVVPAARSGHEAADHLGGGLVLEAQAGGGGYSERSAIPESGARRVRRMLGPRRLETAFPRRSSRG